MTVDVKKKIRPGLIHLADSERAIVVEYEQEEFPINADGSLGPSLGKQPGSKKIKVKSINASTNIEALAQELVEKCKLIQPSKAPLVEDLLRQLQVRESGSTQPGSAVSNLTPDQEADDAGHSPIIDSDLSRDAPAERRRSRTADGDKPKRKSRHDKVGGEERKAAKKAQLEQERKIQADQQRRYQQQIFEAHARKYEAANVASLEDYIMELYDDDMERKVHGLGMIAQLFRTAANFDVLLSHPSLLQTLARVLREEGRKSMELAINIVSVFFSISNFSQFHGLIMDHQIGAMTMDLIDLEIKRSELRVQDEGISPAEIAQKVMEAANGSLQMSDRERKLIGIIQKQDRMLYLCFYMLLNLAEDVSVERKMKKKSIVPYLIKMLDRSNVELLILAVIFLKKLSIYKENKEQMVKCAIIEKLNKFLPVRNDVLMMAVLRLMHNLSFDQTLRENMVDAGVVPKAVELMREPRFAPVCMGILYHISMDDKHKSLFTYTPAISLMYDMLMRAEDLRREPELIALTVNLTQNVRCAVSLCEGQRFDRLMKRCIATGDDLLFKVMRNCSQVDDIELKRRFSPYVEQCVMMIKAEDVTADLFVEVLGTLANLTVPEFDFQALVERHDLLNFLAQYAAPGAVDDDILLEVVMFVGVLCNEGTAEKLVKAGLVQMLFQHMGDKKDDDEFVLQITFTFAKLLSYPATREALLSTTDVLYYLVDLLQDKNKEVRKHADKALDIVMDSDPEWAQKIRKLKFQTYNQEWLEIVDQADDSSPSRMLKLAQRPDIFSGDLELDQQYPDSDSPGKSFGDFGVLKGDEIRIDDDVQDYEPELMQAYM